MKYMKLKYFLLVDYAQCSFIFGIRRANRSFLKRTGKI